MSKEIIVIVIPISPFQRSEPLTRTFSFSVAVTDNYPCDRMNSLQELFPAPLGGQYRTKRSRQCENGYPRPLGTILIIRRNESFLVVSRGRGKYGANLTAPNAIKHCRTRLYRRKISFEACYTKLQRATRTSCPVRILKKSAKG